MHILVEESYNNNNSKGGFKNTLAEARLSEDNQKCKVS